MSKYKKRTPLEATKPRKEAPQEAAQAEPEIVARVKPKRKPKEPKMPNKSRVIKHHQHHHQHMQHQLNLM